MPIFEYKCEECNHKYEVLHKGQSTNEEVTCPKCKSKSKTKLFSSFKASVSSSSTSNYCSDGSCAVNYNGGCGNGMCGLN